MTTTIILTLTIDTHMIHVLCTDRKEIVWDGKKDGGALCGVEKRQE